MAGDGAASRARPPRSGPKLENTWLWRLKVHLQFTGWLQYVINAAMALAFLLIAAVAGVVQGRPDLLVWVPLAIGALLLANLVFDIVTLKFGVRPAEALPRRRDDLDAFDLMRARRACRSFQARDLTPADRAELLESARVNCRSEGWIGRRPIRLEYVAAPMRVWPVVGAHEFLVAIGPEPYDRVAVIDLGRSLQKVVLHATRMGLATCWIGPGADQKSVVEHLGDRFAPDRDHVICVCAVGYASHFKPLFTRLMALSQHRRLPLRSLFFADPYWRRPLNLRAQPFRSYGRCYEACRWSPSSYNSQTTRCAAAVEPLDGQDRLVRFDFCASTDSRYYAAVALGIWLANWEAGCAAIGKRGHLAILSAAQRAVPEAPRLPRYDVSWIVAETGAALGAGGEAQAAAGRPTCVGPDLPRL